jgi:hypothetical protein
MMDPNEDETARREILATATAALVSRVGALADAVQVSNHKIDTLRKELAQKPDDEEVQFIMGLAHKERRRHFQWALGAGLVSAIVASGISYAFANNQLEKLRDTNYNGCIATNKRVEAVSHAFSQMGAVAEVTDQIDATKRPCEKLYAKGS